VDNPLYFNLQPPAAVLNTVSPISRQISRLCLFTPEKPTPPAPEEQPPSVETSLVNQFMATLKDITFSPLETPVDDTLTNDEPPANTPSPSSSSGGVSRKRARRHSEGQTASLTIQRQRRYSDTSTVSARSSSINTEPDTTLKVDASLALTLPTPRLTPELNCWRHSLAASEVSTLGETWDSHRLHTLLRQQDRALTADQDTPPFEIRVSF